MSSKLIARSDSTMDKKPSVRLGLPLNPHNKLQHQLPSNQKCHRGLASFLWQQPGDNKQAEQLGVQVSVSKSPFYCSVEGGRLPWWTILSLNSSLFLLYLHWGLCPHQGKLVNTMRHGQQLVWVLNGFFFFLFFFPLSPVTDFKSKCSEHIIRHNIGLPEEWHGNNSDIEIGLQHIVSFRRARAWSNSGTIKVRDVGVLVAFPCSPRWEMIWEDLHHHIQIVYLSGISIREVLHQHSLASMLV